MTVLRVNQLEVKATRFMVNIADECNRVARQHRKA